MESEKTSAHNCPDSFIDSLGLSAEDLRFESLETGFRSKVSRSWKQILPGNTVELV